MLIDKLFDHLDLRVDPFATCRLADGWRLQLPSRDWVTLHYVLVGKGALRLGSGAVLPLSPNRLAIIPAGLVHAVECGVARHEAGVEGQGDPPAPLCEFVAGPLDSLRLTVACGRIEAIYASSAGLFQHLKEAIVLDFSDSPPMRGVFEALVEEYQRSGPASHAMMVALMNQCLIQVLRRLGERTEGALPWLSALDDPRLTRVLDAILDHPEDPHTLDSLAALANMSRATFARHFRRCFGRTPADYVRDVRLHRACALLEAGETSVDRIAGLVGFGSRSHFSRVFKDHKGMSPRAFQKAAHPEESIVAHRSGVTGDGWNP